MAQWYRVNVSLHTDVLGFIWLWDGYHFSLCLFSFIKKTTLQRLSVTRALQRFFPFRKLRFSERQSNVSMTITASGVSRTTTEYNSMSISQSIRVALSSLLDSSINRNWEVRLIKSLEAPFRSSRSRAMFWSCKFTNSAQPQQHETESN